MNYSVVGLGKLGCSMAAAIASRGHRVIGHDIREEVVDRLNAGVAPVAEPGVQELIAAQQAHLTATHSIEEAVLGSDVTFVVVPTPSDERGAFELSYAEQAFSAIGDVLAHKWEPHCVVLTSTVLPGSMRHRLVPVLEEAAGRATGDGLGVCYSPAFIALGSVVHDFLHPDILLIGESDAAAGAVLEHAYGEIMPGTPLIRRMNFENAELTKIAVNTFVTMKISFANMIAALCERLPGGDVDTVAAALGADRRIGRAYLTGALGYGGPCFPRDNRALSFVAHELGADAPLAAATDDVNRMLPGRVLERIRPHIRAHTTVGVLGLAYKPGTPVLEASQSVEIAASLAAAGARVLAHDPLLDRDDALQLGPDIQLHENVRDVLAHADVIIVTSPDPAYRALTAADFRKEGRRVVVYDLWRILRSELAGADGVEYVAIGLGETEAVLEERLRALWVQREPGRRSLLP